MVLKRLKSDLNVRPAWGLVQNDRKCLKPCFHEGKVWETEKKTCLTREEIVDCNYFRGRSDHHIRVAVKIRQETEWLLEAFTKLLKTSHRNFGRKKCLQ